MKAGGRCGTHAHTHARTYIHTYANINTHVCAAAVEQPGLILSPVGDGYKTRGAALLPVTAGPPRPLTSGKALLLNEIPKIK